MVFEYAELDTTLMAVTIVFLFILSLLSFEFTKKQLKKSIDGVVFDVIDQTDDETKKIETTTNSQKENINLSFAKITNIVSLLENLKEYISSMNEVISKTQAKTSESLNFTNTEHLAVKANIEKMFAIRHKIQTIAELILELSEFIQSISSTIGVVEDIAEQTNLLALNAAVEAARAGEHGKGFAVVAGEIRKLADESKQATTKITSLITDIQQTTNSTVMATEEGTKEIETGIDLAHSIGSNIEQLIGFMNEITTGVNEIIASSDKLKKDTQNTGGYIKELTDMLEANFKITEENYKNIENLHTLTKSFKTSVLDE